MSEQKLYAVMWCKNISVMAQLHGDYGTTLHMTTESATSGKTLCGRKYPVDKGYPSWNRTCKRCKQKALAINPALKVRELESVP